MLLRLLNSISRPSILKTSAPPLSAILLGRVNSHLKSVSQGRVLRTMASSIPIPKTVLAKTGGTDVLQYRDDLPVPVPKEGEVLVKNDFAGVNFIDIYFRSGLYPSPLPLILGREAEGTIVSLGPSSSSNASPNQPPYYDLKPSSRVVYMNTASYAEYTVAPVRTTYVIPEGIKPGDAAASLIQGLTALAMVRESCPVKKGEWVLVRAAAGGTGGWICQLLKVIGARVIGTTSTEAKAALASENGDEFVLNSKEQNVAEEVLKLTDGRGVTAVFDGIGKDTFEEDLKITAKKGTIVSFGNASGPPPDLKIALLGPKNLKVCRPVLFGYIETREEFVGYLGELFDIMLKYDIKVKIHDIYPLAEVRRVHEDLQGSKTTGKLLLKL